MSVNLPESLSPSQEEQRRAHMVLRLPTPGATLGSFNRPAAEEFLCQQGWEGLVRAEDTDVDAQKITIQAGLLLHSGYDPRDPVFQRAPDEAPRVCLRRLRTAHQHQKMERQGVPTQHLPPDFVVALAVLTEAWQEAALADHLGVSLEEVRAQVSLPFFEVSEKVLHFRQMRNQRPLSFPREPGESPDLLLQRLLAKLQIDFPAEAVLALAQARREVAAVRGVMEQKPLQPPLPAPSQTRGRSR